MSSSVVPKLFQPVQVGEFTLAHRVVLAPLTRFRANKDYVHGDLAVEYYSQRASVPGTLLITEATLISAKAGGFSYVPGIWNNEQVAAWRRITKAVHAKGSRIFCQLWALGRAAHPDVLKADDPSYELVSASNLPLPKGSTPRALTISEIEEYVQMFTSAAQNAMRAGFDGIELHGANGYLIDQFLQDVSNNRTDMYGGSVENRARFVLEVIDSIARAIGASRVAIRISPWSHYQDMRMRDPKPTFAYLVSRLASTHTDLAYIHVIEPRIEEHEPEPGESNDFLREIWAPRAYISAGGYKRQLAFMDAEKTGDLIAFGRLFLANPDLPTRIAKDLPLNIGNRDTYYYVAETAKGYTDYPLSDDPRAAI
ncbi:uncharacterized protein FIBRA_01916 [Fibroporia radiculosa]|uniref:NADH:flavin oxidoreductase/NADH oxidase N-terminal domain-containing protein n=1 Tax=Fibroporia radiculosa TaxID=599839 RepID=J4I8R9_9APHY|nr:uncharacterized protein FIBRA_01916 [Fibroporia radiculosa]CCL99891.1 predicted protein [Fibroporia radiculosa]